MSVTSNNGRLSISQLSAYPNYKPLPGQPVGSWAGNLRADAARALASASSHCEATIGLPVTMSEGYRDLNDQKGRWHTYQMAGKPLAALPGTSNHGWGIAADIREDAALTWLDRNGIRFGWAPTGKKFSRPEPWHFDYVGGGDLENSPILRPSIPELMEEEMANPRLIQRNGSDLAVVEIPGAGAKKIRDEAHYAEIRNFYNAMKIRLVSPTAGLIEWPEYKRLGGHYTRLSANGYDECMMFYKP